MELADAVAASAAANGMVTAVKLDAPQSPHTLRLRAEIAVVTRSLADMKALKLGPGWRIVQPGRARLDRRLLRHAERDHRQACAASSLPA